MFVTFSKLGHLGRLGNQLFQVAATIGIASKHHCEFRLPPWRFANCFNGPFPTSQEADLSTAICYQEESFTFTMPRLTQSADLRGFFQSEKYFLHCHEEIQQRLSPHASLPRYCHEKYGRIFKERACSIHVRRGDYVNHPYFTDLCQGNYYEQAMSKFPRDSLFLVFSDDIAFCKTRFIGENFFFVSGENQVTDLCLMSMCQSHIIANSSFSWWGAWLNPSLTKTVIAPRNWFAGEYADSTIPFRAGVPHRGFLNTSDLIPENWTKL